MGWLLCFSGFRIELQRLSLCFYYPCYTTPNIPSNSEHTSPLIIPPLAAVLRASTPSLPSEEESKFKVSRTHEQPPWSAFHILYLEGCLAVVIADVLVGTTEKQDTSAALLLGGSNDHTGPQRGKANHGRYTRG